MTGPVRTHLPLVAGPGTARTTTVLVAGAGGAGRDGRDGRDGPPAEATRRGPAAGAGCGDPSPVEVYEAGLRATERGDGSGWRVRYEDGRATDLPLAAWTGGHRPGDDGLLDRCTGPTLDLGCGPGRLTALLTARGVPALGVDVAAYAVALTRDRGGPALHRDLFGPLPGEGGWAHVLLADGNVGIGGDPEALLRRCARLLHPFGSVLCETDAPGTGLHRGRTRLEPPAGPASAWFPWAHVDAASLSTAAAPAGLGLTGTWTTHGRWFAALSPGPV